MTPTTQILRTSVRLGLIAAIAALPVIAQATPTLPTSPSAALHLGGQALDIIAKVAASKLPTSYTLPNISEPLLSCPIGSGISASISNATVNVQVDSLAFQPAAGTMGVAGVLNLSGGAHVLISNGYACVSDAECDVTFAVQQFSPSGAISIAVDSGIPSVSMGALDATVPSGGIQVSFANCALDELSSGVTDAVATALFNLAKGPLIKELQTEIPPVLQTMLSSMLTQSGNIDGYDFIGQLGQLDMTANGIDAYAAIGVAYDATPAACLAPGTVAKVAATSTPANLSLPSGPTSQVVLGVSTDLISNAIQAAWQAGVMCVDDSEIAALGFDPNALAALIPGLPAGLTMHFSMGLDNPPVIGDDGKGGLQMTVTGAELLLALTSPGQAPAGMAIVTDFTAAIAPQVNPNNGSVYASLTNVVMTRLDIDSGSSGTSLNLDPERLNVLMTDLIIPMANTRLQAMPIAPASFGAEGIYAWLDALVVKGGGVYVGLEPYLPGPAGSDKTPPSTLLVTTPGKLVRAGAALYTLGGTDDQTPSQLLQYEWQVDGGTVVQAGFSRVVSVPVTTSGMHTFQARAIDLSGNIATDWVSDSFTLDAVPPTLTVLEQPAVAVRTSSVDIKITGTDNMTPVAQLTFAYRVEVRQPGGTLTTVQNSAPAPFTDGQGAFTVHGLASGSTYQVTVMVYDQAGNVTSQQIGFGAADIGGCSMSVHAQPTSSSVLSLALLALALILVRRRAQLASR